MSLPTNFKSSGGFDANNQKVLNLADATNPQDALNLRTFDAKNTVQPYNPLKTYNPDFIVEFAGQLWKCIGITGGQFDKTKWTAIRGTENWIRITGAYTASAMDTLYVDTFNSPLVVTLPITPKSGDYVRIIDAGNADKNAITIVGNGASINGGAGITTLVRAGSQITAIYLGGTWITTFDLTINRVRFLTVAENLVSNVMYTMLVSSSFSITLPTGPRKGDWVSLTDQLGTVGSNPITVLASDKQINGQNSFLINQKKSTWQLVFDGNGWIAYNLNGDALLASNNLSDITDKAAARSNLGLGSIATFDNGPAAGQVRSNGQNDLVYQPLATILTNLAQLVLSANKLIYATGTNTFATTDFGALARTFLAATTTQQQRNALELGTAAVRNVGTATGNVMEVGAFGLGKTPSFAGNIDDTSVVPRGWVIVDKNNFGTTGTFPVDSSTPYAGTLHTFGDVNGVGVRQIFHTITGGPGGVTNNTYIRDQYSNNWGPWRTLPYSEFLGTASKYDVGTNPGQVMLVGAFGLGTNANNAENLNTLSGTQFFITSPTTVNDPPGFGTGEGKQGYGYQIAHASPAWRMQQWTNVNSMRTFQRICIASTNTWTPWVELITSQNLGTSPDSIMQVKNSFGLGVSVATYVGNIDDATTIPRGWVGVDAPNGTTGTLPFPNGILQTFGSGTGGGIRQIFNKIVGAGGNTNDTYIRDQFAGTWGPWVTVTTNANQFPAWTNVTYLNGWTDYAQFGTQTVGYRLEGKRVFLRGTCMNPTANGNLGWVFTLPAGYRPLTTKIIPTIAGGNKASYMTIATNGQCVVGVYPNPNETVLFDSLSFEID